MLRDGQRHGKHAQTSGFSNGIDTQGQAPAFSKHREQQGAAVVSDTWRDANLKREEHSVSEGLVADFVRIKSAMYIAYCQSMPPNFARAWRQVAAHLDSPMMHRRIFLEDPLLTGFWVNRVAIREVRRKTGACLELMSSRHGQHGLEPSAIATSSRR